MAKSVVDLNRAGNALCLDFVNTVSSRGRGERRDYLGSYADLVTWARMEGVLAPRQATALRRAATDASDEAARVLAEAIALRETIHALVLAMSERRRPASEVLAHFNVHLTAAMAAQRLTHAKDGFRRDLALDVTRLDALLWPIVLDAAELVVERNADRVRQCSIPEGGCGWVFLDTSKGNRRQWCRMAECGNVAKSRRFRARKRKA